MIITSISCLCACSRIPSKYQVFRDNEDDYIKSRPVQPLKIPPGYSSNSVDDYYPIPDMQTGPRANQPSPLMPPNINPQDVPPPVPWWKRWIPHAHMPWDPPGQ